VKVFLLKHTPKTCAPWLRWYRPACKNIMAEKMHLQVVEDCFISHLSFLKLGVSWGGRRDSNVENSQALHLRFNVFKMPVERANELDEGRRDRHDIMIQILSILRSTKSIRKTRLMTLVGLSSAQSRLYLGFLENNRLIQTFEREISVTQKGLALLEKCSSCPMFECNNSIWRFNVKKLGRLQIRSI
jgi:predicted transcriptional regulator